MGTDKRARHKAGHNARINVERSMAKRARTRSRILKISAGVIGVGIAVVALVLLSHTSSSSTSASTSSTTSTTVGSSSTTAPKAASAAGKPCVPLADPLPAGAPNVDMPVGPPPTSLQITDITTGSGTPVVSTDTVTVNYIGVSCSTGKIFDSSWSRGQTATFGLNQVIKGWTQGLVGMQPGGERLLVIPPDLGYGSSGQGGIAPDETLVFVVDLVSATPGSTTTTRAK